MPNAKNLHSHRARITFRCHRRNKRSYFFHRDQTQARPKNGSGHRYHISRAVCLAGQPRKMFHRQNQNKTEICLTARIFIQCGGGINVIGRGKFPFNGTRLRIERVENSNQSFRCRPFHPNRSRLRRQQILKSASAKLPCHPRRRRGDMYQANPNKPCRHFQMLPWTSCCWQLDTST